MKHLDWNACDADARTDALARPGRAGTEALTRSVAGVLDAVAVEGDHAVRRFTQQFDGLDIADPRVTADEMEEAMRALDPALQAALESARERIARFHRAGMQADYEVDTAPGVRCARIARAIRTVGLYVPAGSAPLPSTALMLGVPAQLAGCARVVLCTPPRADGGADPAVLAAARLCGITEVFKVGGAQAIAAMAFGAGAIPACDKLFGPGNSHVTEAKRQVAQRGRTAIDMPAGPSEVLVIADGGADPAFVAADLLSQAEHGPDSQVLLLSDDAPLLAGVDVELDVQLQDLPRAALAREALAGSRMILVESIAQAIEVSNDYAPEHLILALREPDAWLPGVTAAGSVFLGDHTPEALGDYCSGTNHVLPTGGAAAAYSGVSVSSFQTFISVQSATAAGIAAIGPDAITMALAEGLDAHARAPHARAPGARGMNAVCDLLRPDLRGFEGYRSARSEVAEGEVWLNANEAGWASSADPDGGLRRYPDPQPRALVAALASLYGCRTDQLLVGRGSDEAIDLLVRAACAPGADAVLVTPPVFGMYAVSARLQGARLVEVPLVDSEAGFGIDVDAILAAVSAAPVRVVFLCSPSNPTGGVVPADDIATLATALEGRALVVVDEAYAEFADSESAIALLDAHANLAVLRTLSKAHALAAARIGVLVAHPQLVAALRACQAPYPVPAPCATLALAALSAPALAHTRSRRSLVLAERSRMASRLAGLPQVTRVYPSQGNFLLVRFTDAGAALAALLTAGVVVRDQRGAPALGDALRITIGTLADNDRVLSALSGMQVAA